jgi:hypothetical protein
MATPLTLGDPRGATSHTSLSDRLFHSALLVLACGFLLVLDPHELLSSRWFHDERVSRRTLAEVQMANIAAALDNCRRKRGRLPESLDALTVGTSPDPEPWLSAIPQDPWGRLYEYRIDGDRFTLRSLGEDGARDTDDDVRWPRE